MADAARSTRAAPLCLSVLPGRLAICQLDPREGVPSWASKASFFSVSRTTNELSVVCPEQDVPAGVKHEAGWRALEIEGPLEFGETGVLLSVAAPLAEAGVSIFAISTFDTDYVLLREEKLEDALHALRRGGLKVQVDSSGVVLRPATEDDEPFLWEMLAEAAQETSVRAVAENPGTARYVESWGREGDLGFVSVARDGEPLGAAWVRLLRGKDAGYGYVDDETPELAIGLRPEARGKGIGMRLLSRLVDRARARYGAMSLSVRADNSAALRLYERVGFEPVAGSERMNSVGGVSLTMKLDLTGRNAVRPATGDDEPFLWEMLYESVHWGPEEPGSKPPPEELLADPMLVRYVTGWGRAGDLGMIALDTGGRPVGAAWSRLFTESEPAYGFVDAATPVIAIAVAPEARGMGVGGALLDALLDAARSEGFEAISLSVQRSNPVAARLYEKRGFVRLHEEGDAWVMEANLSGDGRSRSAARGDG